MAVADNIIQDSPADQVRQRRIGGAAQAEGARSSASAPYVPARRIALIGKPRRGISAARNKDNRGRLASAHPDRKRLSDTRQRRLVQLLPCRLPHLGGLGSFGIGLNDIRVRLGAHHVPTAHALQHAAGVFDGVDVAVVVFDHFDGGPHLLGEEIDIDALGQAEGRIGVTKAIGGAHGAAGTHA